jgi:hypothetical protein
VDFSWRTSRSSLANSKTGITPFPAGSKHKAKIVFDHFHVIKLFNDKLSDLRLALYREATDVMQKAVLKGTRWLLLKNPENLDEEKDEKQRLKKALAWNQPLATDYYSKDDLRRLSVMPSEGTTFSATRIPGREHWVSVRWYPTVRH